jgi:hypothetical protein
MHLAPQHQLLVQCLGNPPLLLTLLQQNLLRTAVAVAVVVVVVVVMREVKKPTPARKLQHRPLSQQHILQQHMQGQQESLLVG